MRWIPTFLLAAVAAVCLAAPAGAALQRPVEFDTGWEHARSPDGPWKRVQVPHVFDARADERLFNGATRWYRLRFRGPHTNEGWGWDVRFDAVRRRADVFLNGRLLGRNSDPYTPFSVPAKGMVPGRTNTLTVRVDNRRTPGFREGWWNWGGITRAVRLEPRGRIALKDTALLSQVECSGICRASVLVDGWVTNHGRRAVRPDITVRLDPPAGGDTTERTFRMRTIRPGETARLRLRTPVRGTPQLWAPERPALYSGTVTARVGKTAQDTQQDRVGLRSVAVRDGHLWLNGRRLELRGASIQEDMPGRGPALTDADVKRIVDDLKAVNANVTRAHYLLDERLLDRLDEAGILVWSQAPVYHRDVQLRTPAGRDTALGSVRRTVIEARRHPSVITHSVANELSPQPDETFPTRDFLARARAITRQLDPTVPVSLDILAWPGFPKQESYRQFDLLGINSYFGWYKGDEDHETGDLRDLAPFLDGLPAQYPEQAFVMTEFGAEATMDGPAGLKETYAFQSRYLRNYLDIVERRDFLSGAIYWTLREFAVKPNWDGGAQRVGVERDGIHNKGLLRYADGVPKPAWNIAAANFGTTPMYRTAAPRSVAAALDERPRAVEATRTEIAFVSVVLTLLAVLAAALLWAIRMVWRLGDQPPPPQLWDAEPEPGERRLRAVA